jgi:hypothetical protein
VPKTHNGEKTAFSKKWCQEDWHLQKTKTRPLFLILYKNQLKAIKGLNLRPDSLKLLEENPSTYIGNDFLTRTPITQEVNSKN